MTNLFNNSINGNPWWTETHFIRKYLQRIDNAISEHLKANLDQLISIHCLAVLADCLEFEERYRMRCKEAPRYP